MRKTVHSLSTRLVPKISKKQRLRLLYISSYVPRRCGIATFTKDVILATRKADSQTSAEVVAMSDEVHPYPDEVTFSISQHKLQDYIAAAHYINQSSADVVNLQHEFGLYGGNSGEYILSLLDKLAKPLVTNFHSVLPNPTRQQQYIMRRVIEKSMAVIAMTDNTRKLLEEIYDCCSDKIKVIYHGVPDFKLGHSLKHRKRLGIAAAPMILSFGLIGPGKGLEYLIGAMQKVVAELPTAKAYIVGQTHPGILKEQGEKYRKKLEMQVKQLSLDKHIIFVNRYVAIDEFKSYYQATDFFVTAHLDPQQPVSGTLSYALGAGNVCISTPYQYAQEVLSGDTGILVDFQDADAIAAQIIETWTNPRRLLSLKQRAYQKGNLMAWSNIGLQYIDLFRLARGNQFDAAYERVPASLSAPASDGIA